MLKVDRKIHYAYPTKYLLMGCYPHNKTIVRSISEICSKWLDVLKQRWWTCHCNDVFSSFNSATKCQHSPTTTTFYASFILTSSIFLRINYAKQSISWEASGPRTQRELGLDSLVCCLLAFILTTDNCQSQTASWTWYITHIFISLK